MKILKSPFKQTTAGFMILFLLSIILFSCSTSDDWDFSEGGSLLWVSQQHKDSAIKKAVRHNLENSSIIVAQIQWSPNNKSFFKNTGWYFSLAKDHGKKFMIAIDWQKADRSGTKGGWSFKDEETARLFKEDMLMLIEVYNPDFVNLGVEINYYALTSSTGFKAYASLFKELKQEIRKIKPELKVGLSYQLELLFGHHNKWNETGTITTLNNLLGDIDYLGISTFPNMVTDQKKNDLSFSLKYLDTLKKMCPVPIGISETGISSKLYNENQRKTYVKNIFQKANDLDFEFVIWGSMIDSVHDNIWSDKIGLLDKDGQPKKEFNIWQKKNLNLSN